MSYSDSAEATAARGQYVTEVQRLVDQHVDVLFAMVTAAAARVSTGDQPIEVTCQARSFTVSTGTRTAVFHIEAITDRPKDLRLAARRQTGQARCILPLRPMGEASDTDRPLVDGSSDVWELVLRRADVSNVRAAHTWMDVSAQKPLDAAAVAATLRSWFV